MTTYPLRIAEHDATVPTDVWLAKGLHLPWRVCSIDHTYGEWENLAAAEQFLDLLVVGNPDLRRLG